MGMRSGIYFSPLRLPIQLQRKLNLSWIVRIVARGRDPREILRVRKIQGNRLREVGVVGEVEEFRTKLDPGPVGDFELLEHGPVQPVEAGPPGLSRSAAQRRQVRLADSGCDRRVMERQGIQP